MKGIILAGGYATRLLPLTENTPKHLLPIGGKPMLDYLMARLAKLDIDTFYLVTNDKFARHFEEWAEQSRWSDRLVIVNDGTRSNEDRLGAIGDMLFPIDKFGIDDDLFIIGADVICDFDFNRMYLRYKETEAPVLGVFDVGDPEQIRQLGEVVLDDEGKVASFREKPDVPQTTLASTLFYMLPRSAVPVMRQCMAEGRGDNAGWLIQALAEQREVYGVVYDGYWIDIGTMHTYELAQRKFSDDAQ
ncbi:MAG: nucleotidyltransferase family protein [Nanoarchaeota archaeon]